jgi:hypothetical protein
MTAALVFFTIVFYASIVWIAVCLKNIAEELKEIKHKL